jgi:hypothetical protein
MKLRLCSPSPQTSILWRPESLAWMTLRQIAAGAFSRPPPQVPWGPYTLWKRAQQGNRPLGHDLRIRAVALEEFLQSLHAVIGAAESAQNRLGRHADQIGVIADRAAGPARSRAARIQDTALFAAFSAGIPGPERCERCLLRRGEQGVDLLHHGIDRQLRFRRLGRLGLVAPGLGREDRAGQARRHKDGIAGKVREQHGAVRHMDRDRAGEANDEIEAGAADAEGRGAGFDLIGPRGRIARNEAEHAADGIHHDLALVRHRVENEFVEHKAGFRAERDLRVVAQQDHGRRAGAGLDPFVLKDFVLERDLAHMAAALSLDLAHHLGRKADRGRQRCAGDLRRSARRNDADRKGRPYDRRPKHQGDRLPQETEYRGLHGKHAPSRVTALIADFVHPVRRKP